MSKTMEKSAETGYFHAYGNRGIILVSADFKEERGLIFMYVKLSIPERLKDLRVVDKHLTLEQLANETGLSRSALAKYEGDGYMTSARLPLQRWLIFTACLPIT